MRTNNQSTIPVMLCFNDNYSIPGMIAIRTLLKRSSSDYHYDIHVMHSNISLRHSKLLERIVGEFPNASIVMHCIQERFAEMFAGVKDRAYWSQEIFCKCFTPSFFPQYDRLVITDADVVFVGDISLHWKIFCNDNSNLLAGYPCLSKKSDLPSHPVDVKNDSDIEYEKVLTCAGFWFQNLHLMREDNTENRFSAYIEEHLGCLTQPEQQVVNIVCHPRILILPPEGMVMGWNYKEFRTREDYGKDLHYSAEEVEYALLHPIQLHYAGGFKPWNAGFVEKGWVWWKELLLLGMPTVWLEAVWRFLRSGMYMELAKVKIREWIPKSSLMRLLYRGYRLLKN